MTAFQPKTRRAVRASASVLRARFAWRGHVYLIHSVTARCNARCGFCAWSPDNNPRGELTLEEIKSLYAAARRAGFVWLSMWGGEPLVHRDIGEMAQWASSLGLTTNMVTNGFLLDRRMEDTVPHLDRLCISLDFPSERHDEVREIEGLYGKIVDAARTIRHRFPKKRILFNCTLMKESVQVENVRAVAELCRELGVTALYTPLRDEMASLAGGDADLGRYVASDAELAEALTCVKRLKREGYPILNSHSYLDRLIGGRLEYRCRWPRFILPIEANGDVVDCMHWGTRPVCNVRETPFEEILKHPRLKALAGKEGEACSKCVSVHRFEVSEIARGNFEPLVSWARALG